MKIPSEILQNRITIPRADGARRIVSLSSGYTEALFAMGFGERIAGVSAYCSRYAACENLPVVGDYLKVDNQLLSLERGWQEQFAPAVIASDITRGRNIIHDGPSLVETAAWVQEEIIRALQ